MRKKELFIFDMDGVLIASEPLWQAAQINVLAQLGVVISVQDCISHTMGKRLDDIANTWIMMHGLHIDSATLAQAIVDGVVHAIREQGEAKPGIYQLLDYLRSHNYRIALATSSSGAIIDAVITKLNLQGVFELMVSADQVANGKPAPDVYLATCEQLGVRVQQAWALEDSFTGVRAAVAAGISTIAFPDHPDPKFAIADYQVQSTEQVIAILIDTYLPSNRCL